MKNNLADYRVSGLGTLNPYNFNNFGNRQYSKIQKQKPTPPIDHGKKRDKGTQD